MGTRFGRGVVLMISPTWWNFVTFLTLFSDSVFRLVLTVSLIIKCFFFKLFVSCSVHFVIRNSSGNLFKEVHPKMFASYELFGNRNMEMSNSKVEFKMHRKAVRNFTRVSMVPENMSRYVGSACFITWCG